MSITMTEDAIRCEQDRAIAGDLQDAVRNLNMQIEGAANHGLEVRLRVVGVEAMARPERDHLLATVKRPL